MAKKQMEEKNNNDLKKMEKIVALCKRRGFVYSSSEIYGGLAAVYDYGPYGVELVNNIKDAWWKEMVRKNDNIVGLDAAIFMSPRVWEASGHVAGFSDPLSECKKCHARVRVDHALEGAGVFADEKMSAAEIDKLFTDNKDKIKCPSCGASNFSPVKKFNLLVQSNLGNFTGDFEKEPVYLRGETCQGIYVNYKNVLDSTRVKVPFGIAQIGKAFRNEITARQFIFRTREFEQMELQYFVRPENELIAFEELRNKRFNYYLSLGIKPENLRWHQHENLVFYAKAAYDIEYNFPFGFSELEGVHARGNYDLTQHTNFSGQDLNYLDPLTQEKYIPHVVESSVGVGRTFLAVLSDSYCEEEINGEVRTIMKLPYKLAPIKLAVFPLLKNKPELVAKAREIFDMLKEDFRAEFDDNGNIGKRYSRQDEIGTPFCLTVDFDSLENDDVTVRERGDHRGGNELPRLKISELKKFLLEKI